MKGKRAFLLQRVAQPLLLVEVTGELHNLGIQMTELGETEEEFRAREAKEKRYVNVPIVTLPVGQTVTVDELEITLKSMTSTTNLFPRGEIPKEPWKVRHVPDRPYYLGPQNRKTKRY